MAIDARLPRTIDLLVVGGGSSGAALAGIVARDTDQQVVLLEAGPDFGPLDGGNWPRDVLDPTTLCTSFQWGYSGMAHPSHTSWTGYDRAKMIGGCSSHNGCVALLGHRRDYDHWAELGNTGWDWESVAPAFERAKAGLSVRLVDDAEITPFQRRFIEGAVAAGIPRSPDMNDPDELQGVAPSPVNIRDGIRWNTALGYLDPVRHRTNLTILGDVLVDRVLLENGRAVGVVVVIDGQVSEIRAERIVLSAGAYGSPAILLRSGIGPEEHLTEVGIEVVHKLPGVGEALTDHPALDVPLERHDGLAAEMDAFAAGGWLPDEQTLAKVRSRHCDEAFDLHLYAVSVKPKPGGHWRYMIEVAGVAPKSSATLKLQSAKPTDAPLIDHGFLSDLEGRDLDVLADGLEIVEEILSTPAFTSLFGPSAGKLAREELHEYARSSVGIYYHPACSCRMGPERDPMAVVDPHGKVHGVDGLYVCDASIFPVIMRANTNLPAVMVAEHLAEAIGRPN